MTIVDSSAAGAEIHAPQIVGALPGTVVGTAEVIDRTAQVLEVFPLRSGLPHTLHLAEGERRLVRGWSPYATIQATVITGGHTRALPLESATREPWPRNSRGSTGWLRLWKGEPDNGWRLESEDLQYDAEGPLTPSVPVGTMCVLQAGGGQRRRPHCTVVPGNTRMTLHVLEGTLSGLLEARPLADSGFTLLEALRLGDMASALAVAQTWRSGNSDRHDYGPSLLDLAVGYLHCRRGDTEQVTDWIEKMADSPGLSGGLSPDLQAIRIWLASRRRRRSDRHTLLGELRDMGKTPIASEGLRILADEARLPDSPVPVRDWLRGYLAASTRSALTSYFAETPDHPARLPSRRPQLDDASEVKFRLSPGADRPTLTWWQDPGRRPLARPSEPRQLSDEHPDGWAAAASAPAARPEQGPYLLVIEHPDSDVLWRLTQHLMDLQVVHAVTFTGLQTIQMQLVHSSFPLLTRVIRGWGEFESRRHLEFSVRKSDGAPVYNMPDDLGELLNALRRAVGPDGV